MHLVTSAGKRCQKLDKRVIAKDALNPKRLAIAFNSQGNDLILAIRELECGVFCAVLQAARGTKGNLIADSRYGPFRQRVVRCFPKIIIGPVTIPATLRTRIKTHPVSQRVVECGSPLPLMHDATQGGESPASK